MCQQFCSFLICVFNEKSVLKYSFGSTSGCMHFVFVSLRISVCDLLGLVWFWV